MITATLSQSIITVGAALRKALHALEPSSPTPRLDAEVLLMHACGLDRGDLITSNEMAMTDEQQQRLDKLLDRRQRGEPVAYITGVREFWSMELNVSLATLIPRPETELLVEKALERIPLDANWAIADLGTGSGAIALALAKERPGCHILATDISSAALEVAKSNAKILGLANVEFLEGDWFTPLAGEALDMIVSNPPYISIGDPHLKLGDVRFEPNSALIAGPDGLDAIRHIAYQARFHLRSKGWLMIEHSWDQSASIEQILLQNGYGQIVFHVDLGGYNRVCECINN